MPESPAYQCENCCQPIGADLVSGPEAGHAAGIGFCVRCASQPGYGVYVGEYRIEYNDAARQVAGRTMPSGWTMFDESTGRYVGETGIRTWNTLQDALATARQLDRC